MTARQVYEGVLIELNKVQAPNLLLEDFNYFFNKAVDQYVNKRYNIYDISQQTTDDVRVLKSTVTLEVAENNNASAASAGRDVTKKGSLYNSIYEFDLPTDYLHLLNCICEYKVLKPFKCYDANTYVQFAAERLTADSWSTVINNVYTRPTYKRPYYYLHNVNRDLINSSGQTGETNSTLDYTSHFYHGKSGFSINQNGENECRVDDNWKIPTDPYGPDINKISTTFTDNDACGESLVGKGTATGLYTGTVSDGTTTWAAAAQGATATQSISVPVGASDVVTYLTSHYQLESTATYSVTYVTNSEATTIKDKFNNIYANPKGTVGGVSRVIDIRNTDGSSGSTQVNAVERIGQIRYGNPGNVRIEIRYGKDNSLFQLERVYVDYIKAPQHIRLSQEQLDLTEDTSQMMEFPDYVCQEIINELVSLVMENLSDPRLPTHVQVTQSIANPAQQQEPAQTQRRG